MDNQGTRSDCAEALRHHGGAINIARQLFPDAPEPWIDLSTGVNRGSYPVGEIPASVWARLPERSDLDALEQAARSAYRASPSADVVAAPGTQMIIQWLPRLFPACRVGVLGPTYAEHERCWRAAGADVVVARSLVELESCDVVVVVNPNNPDGRVLDSALLTETAAALAARNGLLVVDEAFMDVINPSMSLAPALPENHAIVLRSFGKAYGLAGLRLGFAISSRTLGGRLRAALGPWAISGPAIEIGRRALADPTWLTSAVLRLTEEAARLDGLLESAGFAVLGGTPLFRLAARQGAELWFNRLCGAGILTRPFGANPDLLRFGVPHKPEEWRRVEAALRPLRGR